LNVISGEWYGAKILKKMSDVPLTKTYRLSHLTVNFVHERVRNRSFPDFKNVKITFFQQEMSFPGGREENVIGKFCKRFVMLLTVVSSYGVNFKIFHSCHDK